MREKYGSKAWLQILRIAERARGLARLDHRQLPQPVELPPRDFGPLPGVIQLQIGLPVVHGLQRFAGALAQQGQVEVRIGVVGVQIQRVSVVAGRPPVERPCSS